jgi:peptide/nickel transport system substrate-binding protein
VQADRARFYHRMHEVLAEDQPLVFLYWRDELPAVSSRIFGLQPGAAGIRWNFELWYVPRHLHRYTAG